jgi:hypothetical protein
VIARGEFLVVIDPYREPDQVTAYQVTDDGFKQIWQSNGWYGYPDEIFLAPDGMSIVRIEKLPYPLDGKKVEDHSVLFLYFKGKLVKEYRLSELVLDLGSIQEANWGSLWMGEAEIVESFWHNIDTDRKDEEADEETFRSYNHYVFRLKTLEKAELFFDILDGNRIEKKKIVNTAETDDASKDPFSKEGSEQDGTEQPATRYQSKSKGSDKPQPESEGRSR